MPDPRHHPDCPRCRGEGFYLAHHGRGFYRDGSFDHNQWEDCTCNPYTKVENLPETVEPSGEPF